MSKHTLGPWSWHGSELLSESAFVLCTSDSPNAADARLIAAAPDLLEALEAIMTKFEARMDGYENVEWHSEWNVAVRAVAKAKGEQ